MKTINDAFDVEVKEKQAKVDALETDITKREATLKEIND